MTVSLIVAYSRNRTIGKDNALPWKLPGDMAHFKRTTMGCPVIMGRKTWESLGRALPGRRNVVITRQDNYQATGAETATSLDQALEMTRDDPEVFVIGGAQIYEQSLQVADRIVATEVHAIIDGDAFFPSLDARIWQETVRSTQPAENGLSYDLVEYRRKSPA
jgi:dihydrofolate reductase